MGLSYSDYLGRSPGWLLEAKVQSFASMIEALRLAGTMLARADEGIGSS